tara:strand:- start:2790 stop:3032 length:243 start_codon:yes stop_codon:yes gene_type:complete
MNFNTSGTVKMTDLIPSLMSGSLDRVGAFIYDGVEYLSKSDLALRLYEHSSYLRKRGYSEGADWLDAVARKISTLRLYSK